MYMHLWYRNPNANLERMITMFVTERLVHFRKLNNLTQDDLAKRIHVSRQTISHWETGKTYPDIQSLLLLCNIYEISLDQLTHDDINVLKSKSMLRQSRWLLGGSICCIVITYFALISMKWFPMLFSVMILSMSTTLGVVLIVTLTTRTNSLEVHTYHEIVHYMKTGEVLSRNKMSKNRQIFLTILGALLGLGIGLTLTLIIGIWLHWSL